DQPTPLEGDTVGIWAKAWAQIGWVRPDGSRFFEFLPETKGKTGDLPAFKFFRCEDGVLTKLPPPNAPFALDLSKTKITDKSIKDLAALKNLQSLNISYTKITDASLKQLGALQNLKTLSVGGIELTPEGAKSLAALKNLESLDVQESDLGDAALRQLATLTNLKALN